MAQSRMQALRISSRDAAKHRHPLDGNVGESNTAK
jgi:hypothetical protein